MRRATRNFVVDFVGFGGFIFVTATGVLMRYVLPPRSGHFTTIWGLDRHEWGSIHFWLALGFLAVLALHLFLHWRWIIAVLRGQPREGSGVRVGLGIVGLVALLTLAAAPLLSRVERAEVETRRRGTHAPATEPALWVRGFWTLRQIEEKTGVPAEYLAHELGFPLNLSRDENLGRLGRRYGFTMHDVRRFVEEYGQNKRGNLSLPDLRTVR
jgi:hypothetical protein